ncbi:UNVERIFIED_CONTAM: hypothetical protein K2H54_006707 [Gekko kuhli]
MGRGILTGLCVKYNATIRTCQIQGWCPAEVDTKQVPVMLEAENFTLFIKNSIRFPLFNFENQSMLMDQSQSSDALATVASAESRSPAKDALSMSHSVPSTPALKKKKDKSHTKVKHRHLKTSSKDTAFGTTAMYATSTMATIAHLMSLDPTTASANPQVVLLASPVHQPLVQSDPSIPMDLQSKVEEVPFSGRGHDYRVPVP